jgi:hypothetical protein
MAFTAQKATDLLASATSLDSVISAENSDITAFESMLYTNVSNKCFYHILETGEVDGDGYSAYKQLAWCYFAGPFSGGNAAGQHLIFRTFKAKPADLGDEFLYERLVEKKVSDLICIDDKRLVMAAFDAFLDAFKAEIDSKLI